MKRQTAKPAIDAMKFFTKELYVKYNSSDPRAADQAEAAWEQAISDYKLHLRQLGDRLPAGAKKLSKLNLHDAELVNPKDPFLFRLDDVAVIGVAKQTESDLWQTCLIGYELAGDIAETRGSTAAPFSKKNVHWLYDELDATDKGESQFVHRILWSDGRIVAVPFKNVGIQQMNLHWQSTELAVQSA